MAMAQKDWEHWIYHESMPKLIDSPQTFCQFFVSFHGLFWPTPEVPIVAKPPMAGWPTKAPWITLATPARWGYGCG